jgi:GTP-binding protein YchF
MGLSAGIVGLPNVGKSTLFNALTNSSVEAANYPFATINPNIGLAKVQDQRLYNLAQLINPNKTTAAYCTFVDIAGLVKGASQGEGLGNKFLADIREVDVICHVVRCFSDENITHFYKSVDPIRDVEMINLELIISDLDAMEKKYLKIASRARSGEKEAIIEEKLAKQIISELKGNKLVDINKFSQDEKTIIKNYNLLTTKPIIFICNINDQHINTPEANENYLRFKTYAKNKFNCQIIPISINFECELSKLTSDEKIEFMKQMQIQQSGLDQLILLTYKTLGLATFFTFGKDEVKA